MRRLSYFTAVLLLLSGCMKEDSAKFSSSSPSEGVAALEVKNAPDGDPFTLLAGFGEDELTRSRLEVGGSEAKVLWTKGDTFQALFFSGESPYLATFSTQDDGTPVASFTSTSTCSGSDFYCFSPSFGKYGRASDGNILWGLKLPSAQTAVAGGIAQGLNRAFAFSETLDRNMTPNLRFYNLPSLVKFRLSGSVVSRVKEITFATSAAVAGDIVFRRVDGMPVVTDTHFSSDESSTKVILSGDFNEGVDYYIALWPRKLSWFRMEFSDGNGKVTVRQSVKTLNLERSRIKDFGSIALGDDFEDPGDVKLEPIHYMTATEGTKPVTMAVIPEGFTKEELSKYELLAKAGINALFDTEPFKAYRNRFNVYILMAASAESGASVTDGNGVVTTEVHTYFGARWGQTVYGDMRADDTSVFDFVKDNCPDIVSGIHTINEVPVLMIINDSRYGGICWSYGNGKGYAMVPYAREGQGLQWSAPTVFPSTDNPLATPVTGETLQANYHLRTAAELEELGGSCVGDWRNTLVHEFGGHCFGRLGDEYWPDDKLNYTDSPVDRQNWSVPFALNLASDPAAAPWKTELLDRRSDLISKDPHYARIGVFQGGNGYLYGRWRSEKISCMIDNRFYFSAWQRYLIAKRIFTLSGDAAKFNFSLWLSLDGTDDPMRDLGSSGAPGIRNGYRSIIAVPPLPPPMLVD